MSRVTVFVAALVVCSCCRFAVADGAIKRLMADEDSRAKILEHLEELTDLEFADTPLSDVVDYIKSKHEFEIQLDTKGLTDAAVDASAPVTKSLKGISLRSALDLILDDFDLTYTIRDEVLQITSREKADEILYTQIYRVDEIVGERDRRRNMQDLIDLITSTVQVDTWVDSGGPGVISSYRNLLVVDQKLDVHEQIQDLLAKLCLALPKEPEAEAEDRAAAAGPPDDEPSPDTERKIVIYELRHLNPEDARQALTTLIMPDSWQGQGGDGAAYGVTFMPSAMDAKEFQ
ncbi:MAG TPA: hypothetical protein VHD36_09775, partial [Pirellulales bacterium]|nr:hypothetical protein [Pirellulales bacterium]